MRPIRSHLAGGALCALGLASLLLAATGLEAASPAAGTVSEAAPQVSWTGGPKLATAAADCGGPDNGACDNFKLTVEPPPYAFTVEIRLTPQLVDDYDLHMDVTVDREGRALVSFADGCVGSCVEQGPNSGSEVATISRQSSGLRLFAAHDVVGARRRRRSRRRWPGAGRASASSGPPPTSTARRSPATRSTAAPRAALTPCSRAWAPTSTPSTTPRARRTIATR